VPVTILVRKNQINQVAGSIVEKTVDAVRNNAMYMRNIAQIVAPVQTGAFRESIYVNGPNDESNYGEAAGKARALRPAANIVPELRATEYDPKIDRLRDRLGRFALPEALVSSAVDYAIALEEGTVFMPPRPTFRTAALMTEQQFKSDMSKVADSW